MFTHLEAGPEVNTLAVILGFLCLGGSLYLTLARHRFRSRTAKDHPEEFQRVQNIDILAGKYGNLWYLLFGVTWFITVIRTVLFRAGWWKTVYNHAEWTFKLAEKYYERENK